MKLSLDALERRREALVARSAKQRADIASAVASAQDAATGPLLLGAGGVVALVSSNPKVRRWLVRAWAFYALVRRIKGK
jgi:hypothetical protein